MWLSPRRTRSSKLLSSLLRTSQHLKRQKPRVTSALFASASVHPLPLNLKTRLSKAQCPQKGQVLELSQKQRAVVAQPTNRLPRRKRRRRSTRSRSAQLASEPPEGLPRRTLPSNPPRRKFQHTKGRLKIRRSKKPSRPEESHRSSPPQNLAANGPRHNPGLRGHWITQLNQ